MQGGVGHVYGFDCGLDQEVWYHSTFPFLSEPYGFIMRDSI
jgi:hypothetical protein